MPKSRRRHYPITLGDAIGAHERALTFGGRRGIQDLGMVESAIARPYTGYYRSMERKAAALVQSVATNHGFVDGNKRTAFYLLDLLLKKSGYYLVPCSRLGIDREIEKMILDTVQHELDFDDLVAWFRARLRRR